MTPEELRNELIVIDSCVGITSKQMDEMALRLIQRVKSEWCKEQRGNCLEEFNKGIDELIKGRDVEVQNLILNAPEPC